MMQLVPVLVAFLLLTTSSVYAEMVPSAPYTGTPTGTTSGSVLWSQLDDPSGSAWTDQSFEAVYVAYDSWGGDDFIVSAVPGYTWVGIEAIYSPASFTVAGANPLFVNVAFYEDAGGLPGAIISDCDYPANVNFTTDSDGLTIDVDACEFLSSGIRWFSQQVRMDFNPLGQHYWATRSTAKLNPGVWKNPGNGFGNGCLDWQPANAVCGMTGEDWLFELRGYSVWVDGCPPFCDGVPAVNPFGVVGLILALGGGSA